MNDEGDAVVCCRHFIIQEAVDASFRPGLSVKPYMLQLIRPREASRTREEDYRNYRKREEEEGTTAAARVCYLIL